MHFTAPPAIGGIETLMQQQRSTLQALGHDVLFIAGEGATTSDVGVRLIPQMLPRVAARVPLELQNACVSQLVHDLDDALQGCTDCWVHNVLTVALNPLLTRSVARLTESRKDLRWVSWCADITAASKYSYTSGREITATARELRSSVEWIAISETRRDELAGVLHVDREDIQVVSPPIDPVEWLELGPESRGIVRRSQLLSAEVTVLVPAKALRHKGLERAVRLAAAIDRLRHPARILITGAASPHDAAESLDVLAALREAIRRFGVESAVFLLTDLLGRPPSRRTVRELAQLVDVVFLPSYEEGFGLPILEAALLRVPIVCSDIPVFREVTGGSSSYYSESASDTQVARLILEVADGVANQARRRAVASPVVFSTALAGILRDTPQPTI